MAKTSAAPVRSDAYVGILIISLLAQLIGVAFFYLKWSQYPESKPKQPPAIAAPAAPAQPGGPAVPPGPPPVPPGGAQAGAPPK